MPQDAIDRVAYMAKNAPPGLTFTDYYNNPYETDSDDNDDNDNPATIITDHSDSDEDTDIDSSDDDNSDSDDVDSDEDSESNGDPLLLHMPIRTAVSRRQEL